MPGMAAKVVITERQQAVLQAMAFSRSCPQGLAHRAEIILLAFEGLKNEEIAEKLGCRTRFVPARRRGLAWACSGGTATRGDCRFGH